MTATADHSLGVARHRVVIIGAGFGGLFATRALRRAPVEVTVVDRTNHHLFQPLLYQVATGVLSEGDIAPPIREVLRNQRNARVLQRNYRTLDPKSARIILIEATDTVLPPFPKPLRHRAQHDLERLGVEVRLRTLVTGVDPSGLDVKQQDQSTGRIEAYTKIWAAGVQASPLGLILAEHSDATVDRAGRVSVLPDCTLPGHPEAFVVGDLMSLDHLPGVAEVAMQSGIHAARTITRRLSGLAAVAGRAPSVFDRIQKSPRGGRELGNRIPRTQPPATHHYRAASVRTDTRGETTGGGRAGSGFSRAAERARLSMICVAKNWFPPVAPSPWAHADQSGMAGIVKTVKTTPFLTLADES